MRLMAMLSDLTAHKSQMKSGLRTPDFLKPLLDNIAEPPWKPNPSPSPATSQASSSHATTELVSVSPNNKKEVNEELQIPSANPKEQ